MRIDVIDGDTVRFNGERCRLVGIDTPERGDRARCDDDDAALKPPQSDYAPRCQRRCPADSRGVPLSVGSGGQPELQRWPLVWIAVDWRA
jgi:hypothetical protein